MRLAINRRRGDLAGLPAVAEARESSFAAFYRHEYPEAVRLAWLLAGDASVCEDLVQDSFARLFPRFEEVANPSAYVRSIIVNGNRERFRRDSREERRLRIVNSGVSVAAVDRPDELADALTRLPNRQRAAIVLRYWNDLPEAEIAAVLRVRPSTVRTLIHRALETLRREIDR